MRAIVLLFVAIATWLTLSGIQAPAEAIQPPAPAVVVEVWETAVEVVQQPPASAYHTQAPAPAYGVGETAVIEQPRKTAVSPPSRIVIEAIGLDARIVPYDIARTPAAEVAWWPERGSPGQGERIVLWGHNYSAFRPLESVRGGELVEIHTSEGVHTYRITGQTILQEVGVPIEQRYENGSLSMDPIGREQLVMITCWPFPADESHRLVLFAEPVETGGFSGLVHRGAS